MKKLSVTANDTLENAAIYKSRAIANYNKALDYAQAPEQNAHTEFMRLHYMQEAARNVWQVANWTGNAGARSEAFAVFNKRRAAVQRALKRI